MDKAALPSRQKIRNAGESWEDIASMWRQASNLLTYGSIGVLKEVNDQGVIATKECTKRIFNVKSLIPKKIDSVRASHRVELLKLVMIDSMAENECDWEVDERMWNCTYLTALCTQPHTAITQVGLDLNPMIPVITSTP